MHTKSDTVNDKTLLRLEFDKLSVEGGWQKNEFTVLIGLSKLKRLPKFRHLW